MYYLTNIDDPSRLPDPETNPGSWGYLVRTPTAAAPYLWITTVTTFTNLTTNYSQIVLGSKYTTEGSDGVGITNIISWYALTEEKITPTTGFSTTPAEPTKEFPYL